MNRNEIFWGFLLSLMTGVGASCASHPGGQGDETHFYTCRTDLDCREAGTAARCEAGHCVEADSSTPSTGGSAGAGGGGGNAGAGASGGSAGSAGCESESATPDYRSCG